MTGPTQIQMMTQARNVMGIQFRIRPWERMLKVEISDVSIVMLIETFETADRQSRTRFTRRGQKMVAWSINSAGMRGELITEFTAWDEDFVPYDVSHYGRVLNETESIEARDWERDCYRPGNAQFPLDNYDRTVAGMAAPRMKRHFGVTDAH